MEIERPEWQDAKEFIEPGGSLCDIYVKGTTTSDWNEFLKMVMLGPWQFEYLKEGKSVALPVNAIPFAAEFDHLLTVRVGPARVNCHFFTDDEIEVDIDPWEVRCETDFRALIDFMRALGRAVGKVVSLGGEIDREHPFVVVTPE
jgi:hypothetical protein